MNQKIVLGIIWLGFVLYAFFLAPPNQPDTFELIQKMSLGEWQAINPLIISLFNLMGIWPAVYACVLFADGRGQRLRAFPFVLGSFAVGAFILLPYLIFRHPNAQFSGSKDWLLKIWDSRITAIVLLIGALILLIFGFSQGNWQDFIQQWKSDRFIHVMSLDFCLLSLLFPLLVQDDLKRREMKTSWLFTGITVFPLLGPLIYLSLRTHLPDEPTIIVKLPT
ncbi:MAG: DUF2834 domain-containing protein [Snowella sp.]|nr:DUF2834 domain-containing protein [Snowella sp.]